MNHAFEVPEDFWRYAAQLAGARSWPPEDEAQDRFLAQCRRHRLLPLAAASGTFPSKFLAIACDAAAREAIDDSARHAAQEATFERLREILQPGSWIAIKGADYARRLYPAPTLRPMNDIDLLLRADTFDAQVSRLLAQDFAPRPAGPLERSLVDRRNGTIVDLYRMLAQPQRVAIDYDALWSSVLHLDDGTPALAPAHALAMHTLVMANLQFATHLRKYLDLWLLARDDAVAEEAAECAARWRMRRAHAASLTLLARIVPTFAASAAFDSAIRQLRPGEHRWLKLAVLPSSPVARLPARPLALWRKAHLLDLWSQRARFGFAHCRQRRDA